MKIFFPITLVLFLISAVGSAVNAQLNATYDNVCVGLDCDNVFPLPNGAEMKFQATNIRILFDDSSTDGLFPENDWILGVNEQISNGADVFYIEDLTGGTIPFKVFAGAPTNSLVVASSGNVGIGGIGADKRLQINENTAPTLRLNETSTSTAWDVSAGQYVFSVKDNTNGFIPISVLNLPGIAQNISFPNTIINGTASIRNRVEIDSALAVQANACIGSDCSTNEQYSGFRRRLRIKGQNTALEFIDASVSGNFPRSDWSILINESFNNGDNQFAVQDMTAGTIPFIIKGASPDNSFILQESGSISIGDTIENGKLYVNGNVNVNGDVTLLSDMRMKEGIQPLGYGLKEIMQLQPRQFRYKPFVASNPEQVQYGLIAQEVETALPEIVRNDYTMAGPDGQPQDYKGVDYLELIPVLINAVQEQQETIEALKARIAELENKK